jgi:hypothetical protein
MKPHSARVANAQRAILAPRRFLNRALMRMAVTIDETKGVIVSGVDMLNTSQSSSKQNISCVRKNGLHARRQHATTKKPAAGNLAQQLIFSRGR